MNSTDVHYAQPEDVKKARNLAKWLIEERVVKHKTAYIIAMRKYHLPSYDIVRRAYQLVKRKQLALL